MNLQKLHDPFPQDRIHWRAQGVTKKGDKAMALAYIDARDVMDRLDEVCGPQNWQSEFTETPSGRVLCRIGIRFGDDWIWKSDGAGATDIEGDKGGVSDALKRAAVNWGVGRYLYRIKSPWVPCHSENQGGRWVWKKWLADPWTYVRAIETPNRFADAIDDAWEQGILDGLPDDPSAETLADAYADQLEADMENYKTVDGLDGYKAKHDKHIRFVEEHCPERYGPLRAKYLGLRKQLSERKAA